jgi:hypothetical protein
MEIVPPHFFSAGRKIPVGLFSGKHQVSHALNPATLLVRTVDAR